MANQLDKNIGNNEETGIVRGLAQGELPISWFHVPGMTGL